MGSIYLPGVGMVDTAVMRVHRAVNEYDERLSFRRNEDTGDWCVYIAMPHGQEPIPVLGFGTEVPHPEDAVKRVYAADTVRHGEAILDRINRDNEAIREEARYRASEASGDTAERIEKLMRAHGESPVIKSTRLRRRG